MLTTETFEKALDLLELGHTFSSITEETGITTEDAEAVHAAWFNGTSEQVSRELQLAGVLEAAAARIRTGQGCRGALRRARSRQRAGYWLVRADPWPSYAHAFLPTHTS
jgi:hypothetical protein